MSLFFYRRQRQCANFAVKNERSKPQGNNESLRLRYVDECSDANGDVLQDARCGLKFNMLMCWCIGCAASQIKEFWMLPINGKLIEYDSLAVNTIVTNSQGEVSSCDVPFSDDLAKFNSDYLRLTRQVAESCENHDLPDRMVIGTSALAQYDIDGAVGMYSGIFNNPFMIWSKYRKRLFKTTLTVSFQFHHTQMDGAHAARFLDLLQREINAIH